MRSRLGWSTTTTAEKARVAAANHGDSIKLSQQLVSKLENGHFKSVPRWLGYVQEAVIATMHEKGIDQEGVWALWLPKEMKRYFQDQTARENQAVDLFGDDDGPEAPDLTGMVLVKQTNLELGFGGSFLDTPVEEQLIPFPADWLAQFSKAPVEHLRFVRGRGTSMSPTMQDGDICLLDVSRRRLDEQDELWAVAYGEVGMIKRLRKMPDGTVKILSDNEAVPEERATDGELYIIGRCCAVFGKR